MARASTQYISTRPFNNAFYSYDVNSGLSIHSNVTINNCPPGRILKETGRKLYPGIHPSIKTIMTGVYDANTLITGFIDANAGIFALYNTHRAPELTDGLDFNPRGATQVEGVAHKGQSVYTLGDVVAGGQFYPINTQNIESSSSIINVDFSQTSNYTLTLTQDTEINALVVPPNKGTVIYILISGDGVSKLTFNINFVGDLNAIIPTSTTNILVNLYSDGSKLYVISHSSSGVPVAPIYEIVTF